METRTLKVLWGLVAVFAVFWLGILAMEYRTKYLPKDPAPKYAATDCVVVYKTDDDGPHEAWDEVYYLYQIETVGRVHYLVHRWDYRDQGDDRKAVYFKDLDGPNGEKVECNKGLQMLPARIQAGQ